MTQQMRQWIVRDSAAILTYPADYYWQALAAEALVDKSQIRSAPADQLQARQNFMKEACQIAGAGPCTSVA
jgi:hypothetical protein